MFLMIASVELKANCPDCLAYSSDSYFCAKKEGQYGTFIYDRTTCERFRFTGMNVRALARLDNGELENTLTEAADLGAAVIRFFAPNDGLSNYEAIQRVKYVLSFARSYEADPRVQNMKFVIVLVNFYGDNASYEQDTKKYYPKITDGSPNPYEINGNDLSILKSEWFDPDSNISYTKTYQTWVEELTSSIGQDVYAEEYQKRILSFELGNELSYSGLSFTPMSDFISDITSTIKNNMPKTLVSLGSLSTYHTLNGNTSTSDLGAFREAVYKKTGDNSTDMKDKVDFMTLHNYNNEWSPSNTQFGGYKRQDEDIIYAQDNDIPWLVEEFGYNGNDCWFPYYDDNGNLQYRYGGYDGGTWDNPPDGGNSHNIACTQPEGENSKNRACNIEKGLFIYSDAGAMGVMAWGFNPPFRDENGDYEIGDGTANYDRGIGGKETEFDVVYARDYKYLETTWRRGATAFRGLDYFYECETDMVLANDPSSGMNNITCVSPDDMEVKHTISSDVNITYRASDGIDFTIDGVAGYDAPIGANVKAEIRESTCLDCNDLTPTCLSCYDPEIPKLQNSESGQYQFTIQPNPFNTQTEIIFTLTEDAPVTIHVTDIMGKHVATLTDSEMKTVGEHTAIFDGRQYPAGTYITHIQVGEYRGTQKMILVK